MSRRTWLAAHCSLLALAVPVRALAAQRVILIVGDSLSAEYGLPRGAG